MFCKLPSATCFFPVPLLALPVKPRCKLVHTARGMVILAGLSNLGRGPLLVSLAFCKPPAAGCLSFPFWLSTPFTVPFCHPMVPLIYFLYIFLFSPCFAMPALPCTFHSGLLLTVIYIYLFSVFPLSVVRFHLIHTLQHYGHLCRHISFIIFSQRSSGDRGTHRTFIIWIHAILFPTTRVYRTNVGCTPAVAAQNFISILLCIGVDTCMCLLYVFVFNLYHTDTY